MLLRRSRRGRSARRTGDPAYGSEAQRNISRFELIDAFQKERCPLCTLVMSAVEKYFETMLYENVNDPEIRHEIRNSLGYCQAHSAQFKRVVEQTYSTFSASVILEDLLGRLLEIYRHMPALRELAFRRQATKSCPVCSYQKKWEEIYAGEMAKGLQDIGFFNEFKKSGGLCLGHLLEVAKRITDWDVLASLLDFQALQAQDIHGHLKNYIKKHDYRFRERITEQEAAAWKRVLKKISGEFSD